MLLSHIISPNIHLAYMSNQPSIHLTWSNINPSIHLVSCHHILGRSILKSRKKQSQQIMSSSKTLRAQMYHQEVFCLIQTRFTSIIQQPKKKNLPTAYFFSLASPISYFLGRIISFIILILEMINKTIQKIGVTKIFFREASTHTQVEGPKKGF